MTWLDILNVLEEMPIHLLKQESELWHYDDDGSYDVLPIDSIVSPLSEGRDDPDWKKGGAYRLSLQSFDEERKPELNEYAVKIHRVCNVSVMAKDPEQAQRIGENLAGGYTSFACDTINAVMFECDDEFYGVGSPENVHIHLTLDENDSMKVLNGEE
jgi:hypothetical protein